MSFRTGRSGTYAKETLSNATSPLSSGRAARVSSSDCSLAICRSSRMRSSPANASVICVPMDAIPISGAATSPTKKMYMTNSPSVIVPPRIARPPTTIMSTPIAPTITVAPAPTAEVPVIVRAIFLNSFSTASVKIRSSRSSATYTFTIRIPPRDSARRPVASAFSSPRWRNSGRIRPNATAIIPPNAPRMNSIASVSCQFRLNSTINPTMAVTSPPTS